MNIVVLAGGISSEREVSIVTGTMVSKALVGNGHKVILMDVYLGDENIKDFNEQKDVEMMSNAIKAASSKLEAVKAKRSETDNAFFGPNVIDVCKKADIVFMALHGENGENGKVQATFDLLGIKYTGTGSLGSAIAMDKNLSKELFNANGIMNPKGAKVKKGQNTDIFASGIKLPVVVKPACGGSSVGVSIVNTKEEYDKALSEAFKYEEVLVVEEYIEGREFSIGVIDGKALPIIEIAPLEGFYDYTNKYQAGKTKETCPADLPEDITLKMQNAAQDVFKALRLETYARADFMLDKAGNCYCLEANTLPGMTPTSLLPQEAAAIGMDFSQLCEKLIEVSLKKY